MQRVIKRELFKNLLDHLPKKEMSLIVGPRQAGKTTLMNAIREHLEKQGEKTIFLSMDFENDKNFFLSQEKLIQRLKLEFGSSRGYVFLDEIQRKENAGLFLKGIYDMNLHYKFIISGSGSIELKEKIHESLAGRKILFELFPVSFFEFLHFKTDYKYQGKLEEFCLLEQQRAVSFLEEYLNFGGYPRVISSETRQEKIRIMDEIYKSYVEKDISILMKVEKLDAFNSLVKILASNIGKILNYSKLSKTLGISLATVKNYLYYLEKTFIIQIVSPFFRNIRKEIAKSPSVYFYDHGLRNYSLGMFGDLGQEDNLGFAFQNLVFNILRSKIAFTPSKVNFWRTKDHAEVDFIVNSGNRLIPVEAKFKNFSKTEIDRSLNSFIEKYSPATALVVTKNFSAETIIGKTKIVFMPFWNLLNCDL